jgi:hypothetical protein
MGFSFPPIHGNVPHFLKTVYQTGGLLCNSGKNILDFLGRLLQVPFFAT